MKRISAAIAVCLLACATAFAQQDAKDAPASKEDVQRYLEVMHSREMMTQVVDAMIKPMHQMLHEQYMKDKDKLPADFEPRMNKLLDEYMKSFPWDEMLQSMIPIYQKHFTKGDIDAIVAFYSAPTGQKLLKEMPQMLSESMQSMMPLLQKQMAAMQERVQEEVMAMLKESDPHSKTTQKPTKN
jgi:uncharacterized protein